jgi:hypothetical protein
MDIDLLKLKGDALIERVKALGGGCYTEQDGGNWYIVTKDHDDRIGEEFERRDDARRFICVLAGDPMPKGWSLERHGSGQQSFDLNVGKDYVATVWTKATLDFIRRMNYSTLALFGA